MRRPNHEGREQQGEGQQQQIDALVRAEKGEMKGKRIANLVPGQKGTDCNHEDDDEGETIGHRPARDADRIGLLLVALQAPEPARSFKCMERELWRATGSKASPP